MPFVLCACCLLDNSFEDKSGTSVRDTKRDTVKDTMIVNARSLIISPATPPTKSMGIKIDSVVKVDAITAVPTSDAPLSAAIQICSFRSRFLRKIFSNTTTELSTSIPIAIASPAMEIIFRVTPRIFMTKNVTTMETGTDTAAVNAELKCLRKMNSTNPVSKNARIPVTARLLADSLINSD